MCSFNVLSVVLASSLLIHHHDYLHSLFFSFLKCGSRMSNLYSRIIGTLLQKLFWIVCFFWILKEMIGVFRWNVVCYACCVLQLFFPFFFFQGRTLQNITQGRCRTAQSLAKDIIRTPRQSPGTFYFCSLQDQF